VEKVHESFGTQMNKYNQMMHDIKNKQSNSIASARSEYDLLSKSDSNDNINNNNNNNNNNNLHNQYKYSNKNNNINERYNKVPDYVLETKKRRNK